MRSSLGCKTLEDLANVSLLVYGKFKQFVSELISFTQSYHNYILYRLQLRNAVYMFQ